MEIFYNYYTIVYKFFFRFKKKKKPIFKVRKEKSVMYYSGWHKGKPIKEERTEGAGKIGLISFLHKALKTDMFKYACCTSRYT